MTRRKRSHMTEADCFKAFRAFAQRVCRMGETSASLLAGQQGAPDGRITIHFEAEGNFGTGDDLFEAIRILGGHVLPAQADKEKP